MTRLFAALYVSEVFYRRWRDKSCVYAKARSIVLFDRILTGADSRIELNGATLDDYLNEAGP